MKCNVAVFGQFKLLPFFFFAVILLITSCEPTSEITSSWHEQTSEPKKFNKIAVMAIGNKVSNRALGENELQAALKSKGFNVVAALHFLPPDYQKVDTALIENALKKNGVDAVLMVRVMGVEKNTRYVPGSTFTYSYAAPYSYWGSYYYSYGYYQSPGYTVTDVHVMLETALYDLSNNKIIWVAESKAFTNEPHDFAAQYANDVADDLVKKKVIAAM
jgi:hypothetical protein